MSPDHVYLLNIQRLLNTGGKGISFIPRLDLRRWRGAIDPRFCLLKLRYTVWLSWGGKRSKLGDLGRGYVLSRVFINQRVCLFFLIFYWEFHTMHFKYTYPSTPPLPPSQPQPTPSHPSLRFLFCFFPIKSSLCCPVNLGNEAHLSVQSTYQGFVFIYSFLNWFFFSTRQLPNANSSSGGGGILCPTPATHHQLSAGACPGLRHLSQLLWIYMCTSPVVSGEWCYPWSQSPYLALTNVPLLFSKDPWALEWNTNVQFSAEHFTVFCSLCISLFWVSVVLSSVKRRPSDKSWKMLWHRGIAVSH